MCASYGLDPRFTDSDGVLGEDAQVIDDLRLWAERNEGETLLPTGKNLRNLNPIIRGAGSARTCELAWWGYLVQGAPARFPSINTRSERLRDRSGRPPERAIVPATSWFEMQKPQRQWFSFAPGALDLFAMAAVTQPGRTADGAEYTCYSIVMRPATPALAHIHDRMPLLLPADAIDDWNTGAASAADLVDGALAASEEVLAAVRAVEISARP
ncbi:SOS response-associated peptidase family protein [Microbacterium sp. C7(2022)]|uniref:SOS response-associated peptidase family protein n=1 Tax=Microbacterium sp. C7(2022) TaxID=2992759 RepID=UPI00237B545B|nr:SOS response-associated peptidase family protein [Microbacterium sp. C7(2022)]MDE0547003.1 SOS response-associated peptidase [Microbacterium sp. C7(2022)]